MQPSTASTSTEVVPNKPVRANEFKTRRADNTPVLYTFELPDGKKCKVRFPTDEEWCRRQRSIVDITKAVGRDKVVTTTKGDYDANLELFNNIRQDKDGVEFDEYEATAILNMIGQKDVIEVEREGDNFKLTIAVPGAEVVHVLKVPSFKQSVEFGKVAYSGMSSRTGRETRNMLEPSGGLWDKLVVMAGVKGYQDPTAIPIIHKDAALSEVLAQINTSIKGGPDPED